MNTLSANVGLSPDVIRVMSISALIDQIEKGQLEQVILDSLKADYGLPADASAADLVESLKDDVCGILEGAP